MFRGHYWIIPLIIGIILIILALTIRGQSSKTPSWFWIVFYIGIVFVFVAFIMAMSYTIEMEGVSGDYYRYHPQWYNESLEYPKINEVIPPISDTCISTCFVYTPPNVLVS